MAATGPNPPRDDAPSPGQSHRMPQPTHYYHTLLSHANTHIINTLYQHTLSTLPIIDCCPCVTDDDDDDDDVWQHRSRMPHMISLYSNRALH